MSQLAVSRLESENRDAPVIDDPRAVEVRSLFRGRVTSARILTFPRPKDARRTNDALVFVGIALAALAAAGFIAVVVGTDGGAMDAQPPSHTLDLGVLGALLAGTFLAALGLWRRRPIHPDFTVGWRADVDAPLGPEFSPAPAHPLLAPNRADCIVNTTPGMAGEIQSGGQIVSLAAYVRDRGPSFLLPASGSVRLVCGATAFVIARTSRPRALPRPRFTWSAQQHRYTAAVAIALALLVTSIAFIPADPRGLSLDAGTVDPHFLKFLIKPPEVASEPVPSWLSRMPLAQPRAAGARSRGNEGAMGQKTSHVREARYAIKGPSDNPDPRIAKAEAREAARTAGILGILARADNSRVASLFGADSAIGADAEDVLGQLTGGQPGNAYGLGGLELVGTGASAGGTGQGVIGLGQIRTLGRDGNGSRYGIGVGKLGQHKPVVPEILPGIASVRGALDKDIVRRIVRRHVNEVRYCYEQELRRNPGLGGRILVQFTIAGSGQVLASVLQSSSLANPRVESCVVQAVRRWEFPQPLGGGIVIVTYPFVLAPAGAAN